MRKFISLVCVFCMLLAAISVSAETKAEETIGLDFVTYKIENGEATVDWVNRDLQGKVVIPDKVKGYPVTAIGEEAFNDCIYVTEVVLPKSIQNIYGSGFRGCTHLEKINIPCRYISVPIFQKNQNLKEVVLEENLNYLHHGSFSDCKIEKLVIKNKGITIRRRGDLTAPEPQTGAFIDTEISTIYAHKDSDAQKYAEEMGINFVSLDEGITVIINGGYLECDIAPYIKNDRTLVPMRAIFEALGAEVRWDNERRTAIGVKGDVEVKITIGENILYKNGEEIPLDAHAEITTDRTMVPVRAISEAFGALVEWDNPNRIVKICTDTEKTVVRIGTHATSEDDPYFVDPITGKMYMDKGEAEAKKIALKKVEENLGVKLEFVQYTSSYPELVAESIENGEPFCELITIWNGSQKNALDKDILQPLDNYADIFEGEFPLLEKIDGKYYFLSRNFNYLNTWPIVYNIKMLDGIPELKEEDGTTLYPAELYYRGEWTWSGFENYMNIISEYCKSYNSANTLSTYEIVPFETNYTFFAAGALHSVGESVYEQKGTSENALKAIEFTKGLFEKGLISCKTAKSNPTNSGWLTGCDDFTSGKTIFTNCAPWKLKKESIGNKTGVVPFPCPYDKNLAERYSLSNHGGDSVALIKGLDEKTSRMALSAYKMYIEEYYKELGNVNSLDEYIDGNAIKDAENRGIDVNHSEIGKYHAMIWKEFGLTKVNEYSEAMGSFWKWSNIFGKYAFEHGDIDTYRTNVESLNK